MIWAVLVRHKVVAFIGGVTGRVDDRFGKSVERPELNHLALEWNVSRISTAISRILGQNHGAKLYYFE
ncbi:tyrosine--tRNA ligase, chloroplastic mitochondrial [Olea europaea subsp. europaea]|uniref:Tyrosine--tRNA ligase, chloroplastic mitochondrial n=1 Tax=Olea europaea subsp. europaea TaxID=158383 RepID=A0A8S0QC77_OLEEU|nr:tyrosine--tRNA ligase, chloroplastic mitochondrial [Olea europaea subsp. europaea]